MRINSFKKMKLYTILCEGTIAIAFGLMAPMLVGAIGLAMDVSQSYLVRQRLNGAVDAAALAAAATYQDEDDIAGRVVDFISANYTTEDIGILDPNDIEIDVTDNEVTVTASAIYPTTFMRIFGYKKITVSSGVVVARELKGLEVVLVLDNTGSLVKNLTDNAATQTPIRAVRQAATNFVNILFARVDEPDDIKIGVVPYASSVNVGLYGRGRYPDGTNTGTAGYGTPFVTLPSGITYTTSHTTTAQTGASWNGCITEHNTGNGTNIHYSAAATHVTNNLTSPTSTNTSRGQLWSTTTGANANRCMTAATCRGHGYDPSSGANDPNPDDSADTYRGPWDIYSYGYVMQAGTNTTSGHTCSSNYTCNNCYASSGGTSNLRNTCRDSYCWCSWQQTNVNCPYATVMPLTSNQAALVNLLRNTDSSGAWNPIMRAEGATYSNVGMNWGVKLLSHEEPFIEGSDWGDEDWNKAVVLMTDGEMSPGGDSSAYWDNAKSPTPNNINTLNTRLKAICTWLKDQDVIIYTITFKHPQSDISEATKAVYRDCASEPKADHYFHAPSNATLITAFERISGALANLHLKR